MTEIRYPGVFVTEVSTGVKPIDGVTTTTGDVRSKSALEQLEQMPTLADHLRGAGHAASPDNDLKYVSVRRYVAFVEESLQKGLQFAVFEPNDAPLWANVRARVADFLMNEWRNGSLVGTRPEQAFFVHCDRTTMTQDDIDNGRVIVEVGFAPTRPAEFVIVRIGAWAGSGDDK